MDEFMDFMEDLEDSTGKAEKNYQTNVRGIKVFERFDNSIEADETVKDYEKVNKVCGFTIVTIERNGLEVNIEINCVKLLEKIKDDDEWFMEDNYISCINALIGIPLKHNCLSMNTIATTKIVKKD